VQQRQLLNPLRAACSSAACLFLRGRMFRLALQQQTAQRSVLRGNVARSSREAD
jgi:hypothetical protein